MKQPLGALSRESITYRARLNPRARDCRSNLECQAGSRHPRLQEGKRVRRVGQSVIALAIAAVAGGCLAQIPVPPNELRQTALTLEQEDKNMEAEAVWHEISQAHPASPEPFAHLGLLEARQQHYKE